MALDVISRFANKLWVIVEPADRLVAVRAQKPSNFPGGVAVVNRETFSRPANYRTLRPFADRADIVLGGEHGVVFCFRDSVFYECVFEPRADNTNSTLFGAPVAVNRILSALFTRRLQTIRSFSAIFVKLRNRFSNAAFPARFRDAVADRPSVLGMMRVVWHRLALDPPTFGAALGCYRGDLTATTFAKMLFAHGERYNTETV